MDEKAKENPDELKGGANGVVGEAAGIGAGGILGAVMGAGIAGPIGLLVGGTVGTLAGAAIGYGIDYESQEPGFREHHQAAHSHGKHTFDQASPAYRYGWEAHDKPELHDHTYDKARTALHQGWSGSSDFVDYEDYVKQGWERRAASKASGSFSQAAKA